MQGYMTLKVDHKARMQYEPIWWPNVGFYFSFGRKVKRHKGPDVRVWRFDPWGFLFDPFDGFLRRWSWDTSVSPSWGNTLSKVWNNVLLFLTPFYRPRRALILSVIEPNGMKLLYHDRKSTYMRTRSRPDTVYLDARCGLVNMTVRLIRYVDEASGEGVCTFVSGTENTHKEERIAAKGPCLTWEQCDRLYSKILQATPECEWYDPTKEEEE